MSPGALAHPTWLGWTLAAVAATMLVVGVGWLARHLRTRRLFGVRPPLASAGLGADLALLAALALLAIAWLGPRLGERSVWIDSAGTDVVLLLDVSQSMEARDTPPSRLVRARDAADRMLAGLGPGDRAALAAFASGGVLLTPLTSDKGALHEMLPGLDGDLASRRGSDLDAGLRAALGALAEQSLRPQVLVVLSDGEDPDRRDPAAGALAARRGVRVVALAIGSEEGATVPDAGVALRDPEGRVVISRRDAARLARLATATGGALLTADRWGDFEIARALAEIHRDVAGTSGEPLERRVPAVAVAPFALPAFALLWLELTGLPRRRGRLGALAACALCLGPIAGGAQTPRDALPPQWKTRERSAPDGRALFVRGLERARGGDVDAARRALLAAALRAHDPDLAALAYYDLGVTFLHSGALEAARGAFFDALALAPGDAEARFNLEWTLRALAERETREPEPEGPEPEARGAPQPIPSPEATESVPEPKTPVEAQAPLPRLGSDEVERWLDAVEDDPLRSLRHAAGAGDRAVRDRGW